MSLQHHDFGGGYERCVHCGALAAGPCARCRSPVCGDCCVLTDGGTKPYAVCLACDGQSGHSLRTGWWTVLGWIFTPILALILLLLVLGWLFPNR